MNLPIGGVKDAIHEIGGVNNPGNANLPIGVVAKRNFTRAMAGEAKRQRRRGISHPCKNKIACVSHFGKRESQIVLAL